MVHILKLEHFIFDHGMTLENFIDKFDKLLGLIALKFALVTKLLNCLRLASCNL